MGSLTRHRKVQKALTRALPHRGVLYVPACLKPSAHCRVYSRSMTGLASLFATILTLHGVAFAQQHAAGSSNQPPFALGVVVPKVVTMANPAQSYALYLPSTYFEGKRWPIVYIFDPGARGSVPVELMKDAAERYGYILAGSNNSKNGSWPVQAAAVQALLEDTQRRFLLEGRRVYFAGFSGGARVAASIAQLCKCAAGVLMNGAGFRPQAFSTEAPFAVFAAAGDTDFNYPEMVRTDDELEKLRYAHAFRRFSGPHQWAPSAVMDEALAWFRLRSMKSEKEKRDESFVAMQVTQETDRARAIDQSGDPYSAWKEYRQAAETFADLADTTALHARAAVLENDKAVREGAKREKQEFEEQLELSREISSGLAALDRNQGDRAEIRTRVEEQMTNLRMRVETEKREERLRVLKRALAGVIVLAVETGSGLLDRKDLRGARDCFELALAASPDSPWVLGNVAVARVLEGDRKGAMAALRREKAQTKDLAPFVAWLKEEPAFDKLRGTSDFNALLESLPPH